jgi:MYXO-CTERM domain-containing protein
MSKTNLTSATRALAFAGALSFLAITSASAAVVADGTPFNPGVALTGTANYGGTALLDTTTNFAETLTPTFTGTLRTVIVQNGVGTLDFYYQLSNIVSTTTGQPPVSNAPADIFRLTIDGFDPFATGVMDYSTNGLAGIAGVNPFVVGNKSPMTADRDPSIGSGVGFGFASNPGLPEFDPNNLNQGDTSFFMIVRTNATAYTGTTAIVSGFGTALASTYAPVDVSAIPEPGSALVGMAVMGLCGSGLVRRRRQSVIAQ